MIGGMRCPNGKRHRGLIGLTYRHVVNRYVVMPTHDETQRITGRVVPSHWSAGETREGIGVGEPLSICDFTPHPDCSQQINAAHVEMKPLGRQRRMMIDELGLVYVFCL